MAPGETIGEITERLENCRSNHSSVIAGLQRRRAALGVEEVENLQRIASSAFLQMAANAWALKMRLRDRLRERAFERERLQQLYRNTVNGVYAQFAKVILD